MERKQFIRLFSGIISLPLVAASCNYIHSQNRAAGKKDKRGDLVIGDYCDECETMYEGMPALNKINWETTLANSNEPGNRMLLNGTVYQQDGKKPAENIVLYLYHTNADGYYAPSAGQTDGKRNGHLRGWIKTDSKGMFRVNSIRPAAYPGRNIPAHIHILVKEPGKTLYYIDEVWFDDDPLVTPGLKSKADKRGGDLVIHLAKDTQGVWQGKLTITLGLNIPGYH